MGFRVKSSKVMCQLDLERRLRLKWAGGTECGKNRSCRKETVPLSTEGLKKVRLVAEVGPPLEAFNIPQKERDLMKKKREPHYSQRPPFNY